MVVDLIVDGLRGLSGLGSRSIENPSTTLSDPADWLIDAWGGRTDTGISVNRKTALGYAPVWRGINILANVLAKTPCILFERQNNDGKRRAREHPSYNLVRRRPSEYYSRFRFFQTVEAHRLHHGNGYAHIFRRGDSSPKEMIILPPDATWPVRENGTLWYVTTLDNGELRKLKPENVLHVAGLGYDGFVGYDWLTYLAETIAPGIAARKHGAIFFKNAAVPPVVLEHPKNLAPERAAKLRESWQNLHSGLDEKHKTAVLWDGMKATVLGYDANKAQLIEALKLSVRDIANAIGVPAYLLGDDSRTSYNSLEQERRSFLDFSLEPGFVPWEEELTAKLLTQRQIAEDSHFFEFLRADLLKGDSQARAAYYQTAIEAGWMKPSQVQAAENMEVDPEVDFYRVPMNYKILGEEEPEPEPEAEPAPPIEAEPDEPDEDERAAAARRLVVQTAARMCRRVSTQARRAAGHPERFVAWIESRVPEHGEVFEDAIKAVASVVRPESGDLGGLRAAFEEAWSEGLLTAAEVPTDRLAGRILAACGELERELPGRIAEKLLDGR